jgi:hypothetical protein
MNRDIGGFTVSSATYETEPDALMEIADNDMNSLEPIDFNQWNIKPGFKSGWKLFRAFVNIPKLQNPDATGECELKIKELYATEAKLYVDGKLIYSGKVEYGKSLITVYKPENFGKTELRLIIEAVDNRESGIKQGVSVQIK